MIPTGLAATKLAPWRRLFPCLVLSGEYVSVSLILTGKLYPTGSRLRLFRRNNGCFVVLLPWALDHDVVFVAYDPPGGGDV